MQCSAVPCSVQAVLLCTERGDGSCYYDWYKHRKWENCTLHIARTAMCWSLQCTSLHCCALHCTIFCIALHWTGLISTQLYCWALSMQSHTVLHSSGHCCMTVVFPVLQVMARSNINESAADSFKPTFWNFLWTVQVPFHADILKEVKKHKFLVCTCTSQDFAQSQKIVARLHDRETVTFRNSAFMMSQFIRQDRVSGW